MIDIHCHILPGVDDGSESMDMSIHMARIYLENGIREIIATPHYIDGIKNRSKEENQASLRELRTELEKQDMDLEVYLGHEVLVSPEMIDGLDRGEIASLNASRYVLMELPMLDIPRYTEDMIYELGIRGYVPIIAHPERNLKIMEDPNILYRWIQMGALGQLNLPSLEGRYGKEIRATGEILLEHRMVHFLGSDAHSSKKRSPDVEDSLEMLKGLVDKDYFEELKHKNSAKIIEDREIKIKDPREYIKSRSIFDRFRRKKTKDI